MALALHSGSREGDNMQDHSNDMLSILDHELLATVHGGDGDAGQCFDAVWPWAAGGAIAGATAGGVPALVGGVAGGGAAYLTSPACGDGTNSPATQLRNTVTSAASSAGSAIKDAAGKIPHPW
jgi:hypothetical protein